MTKKLIIGLATLSIAGAGLIGSGMYAATMDLSSAITSTHMEQHNPTDMLATLKAQVSVEAYTAFETLMTKQQTEMEALKASGTTPDKTTLQASREALKAEMDVLMEKYPELKTALPEGKMGEGKRGGRMGGHEGKDNAMQTILTGVSAEDKTALEAIHAEYKVKEETLRTEEKTKMDTIISKYPDLKAKLDTIEANRYTGKEGRGHRNMGGHHGMKNPSNTTTPSAQ